jgi:hypothetical protein
LLVTAAPLRYASLIRAYGADLRRRGVAAVPPDGAVGDMAVMIK